MKTSHVILGIGVILATAGTIMYLRKRKANEEDEIEDKAINAIGRSYSVRRRRRGNITPKARMQTFVCTDEDGNTTTLETNNYDEYRAFSNECRNNGGSITQGTGGRTIRRNARISRNKYSRANGKSCGCS